MSNKYRMRYKLILEIHHNFKQNSTFTEKHTIKSLQKDTTIKILPADKGYYIH